MKCRIKLNKSNHEIMKKVIKLRTIYCDVYVPLSQCSIDNNYAIVPDKYFHEADVNPCHMLSGFVDLIYV